MTERGFWLEVEKRLAAQHRILAAEMTLAQELGARALAEALEGACWRLGAAVTEAATNGASASEVLIDRA